MIPRMWVAVMVKIATRARDNARTSEPICDVVNKCCPCSCSFARSIALNDLQTVRPGDEMIALARLQPQDALVIERKFRTVHHRFTASLRHIEQLVNVAVNDLRAGRAGL